MTVNDELRRMWKKTLIAYLKAVCQHFLGECEEKYKHLGSIASLRAEINI
jgi:hypothetical protein